MADTILIVEDDDSLADALAYNLRREGYDTSIARTGTEAVTLTRMREPNLVLLDLMLPEMDGFEVCRAIRSRSTVPIIVLSARDAEVDRVLGLELGADDYVTKPFSLRELLARIHATLRRAGINRVAPEHMPALQVDGLRLEPDTRTVVHNGQELHLLPREFDLLLCLMRNRGIVLSRGQLLEKVWGADYLGDERTVDVHVRRLRSKLEPENGTSRFIRTVHRAGYAFNAAGGSR